MTLHKFPTLPVPYTQDDLFTQIRIQPSQWAKSRGPTTPAGKLGPSQNATQHGIFSRRIILGCESRLRFEQILARLKDQVQPRNPTESGYVEVMAIARWRQMRVWAVQKTAIELEMARAESANLESACVEGNDSASETDAADLIVHRALGPPRKSYFARRKGMTAGLATPADENDFSRKTTLRNDPSKSLKTQARKIHSRKNPRPEMKPEPAVNQTMHDNLTFGRYISANKRGPRKQRRSFSSSAPQARGRKASF